MEKITVVEFEEMTGCTAEDVTVNDGSTVVAVYISNDEECPFTGTEYADGTFGICGLGFDSIVTKEQMEEMLQG